MNNSEEEFTLMSNNIPANMNLENQYAKGLFGT